ncbi:hypothetical protein SDRG_07545 [Saprolegnia diclina VS20]|uniref:EGF-like domain-containing protein n=1 Tax=Saprolegnia diclina (strain VS20) TaxID=1156394 RepID=T0QJ29_SAPDV|nr:hypothetical protein SDRG_07545 [Saprolegnia diclina VS20]EQC34731.1 hypothetical protein SDRG_07545 [Saprolegnia diclina VS20]|eukprot:XP_008611603.1 hypothetical protein SDRG_07545 [Saprolegnia diclina VS20]
MRLPEVVASQFADSSPAILTTGVRAVVTANNRRGEAIDYCATASGAYYASGSGLTFAVSGLTTAFTTLPALVKIKDRLAIATAVTANSITFAYRLVQITFTAGNIIYYATGVTVAADACQIGIWDVGSDSFTCVDAAVAPLVVVGSKIVFENAIYYVRSIAPAVALVPAVITVDRKFNGKALDGSAVSTASTFYILSTPTMSAPGTYTYVSQCSGRGLCDFGCGICQCFKGYTNDNCDTQNIFAF